MSGLLMGYQGCFRMAGGLSTWRIGESADGVVKSIRTYPGSPTPDRRASLISFTAAAGEVVTFEHPVHSSPPLFEKGERVRVFFDPAASQGAVAPGGLALLLYGWRFLAAAGIVVALGGAPLLLVG